MANRQPSHPLISGYEDYVKHMTSMRKSKDSPDRYRSNPFISEFAMLLKLVSLNEYKISGGNKYEKYLCLVRNKSSINSAMMDSYIIYSKTNQKIIKAFQPTDDQPSESQMSLDEIGDYIYTIYQKKRKYAADITLEEIIDFATFTHESVIDILSKNSTNRRAFIQYFDPEQLCELDNISFPSTKEQLTFPLFAIPAYGVLICVSVSPKRRIGKGESRLAYVFTYNDPLGAIKPKRINDLEFPRVFEQHKLETIREFYCEIIATLEMDSQDSPLNDGNSKTVDVFQGMADQISDKLRSSTWYHELAIYERERQKAAGITKRHAMLLQIQKAEEAQQAHLNRKKSLSDTLEDLG